MNFSKVELITLKKTKTDFPYVKIEESADAYKFVRNFYSDNIGIFESSFILLFNRSNTTIGYAKISQGGIIGTIIDTTIIAKYCVEALAKSGILCHNHSSGSLIPSMAEKVITKKIAEVLKFSIVRFLTISY